MKAHFYFFLLKLNFVFAPKVPIALQYSFMGYGAVVPDGYGVSYNLQGDEIIFCVASFFSCPATSSIKMCDSILKSLAMLKTLLTN